MGELEIARKGLDALLMFLQYVHHLTNDKNLKIWLQVFAIAQRDCVDTFFSQVQCPELPALVTF